MFRRRHPFLFFLLVLAAIVSVTSITHNLIAGITVRKEVKAGERVGIVEISGMILDAKNINEHLKRFRENDDIKAIVVRIDSPGGAVGPSQEIFREIRKTIAVKPVVASMGAIAASGGYYIAAGTNGIMANPGTITGSIGVIMQFADFREILEKIGIRSDIIKSGEYKDMGSPFRSLSEKEENRLQQFVDGVHRQFVADVAAGRNLSEEEISAMADGMIFSGEDAQHVGLVDRLGNFNDAVDWAGEKAGITKKIIRVYPPEERYSLIRRLLEMTADEMVSIFYRVHSGSFRGGYIYDPSSGGRDSR
jgi:protease IV